MKVSVAKEKMCPFTTNCIATESSAGRYEVNCITDKCMAWVFTKTKNDYANEDYVEELPRGRKKMSKRRGELQTNDKEGYCMRLVR